jgi:hypothetical protein
LLMLDASTGMKIFQSDALLDDIDEFHWCENCVKNASLIWERPDPVLPLEKTQIFQTSWQMSAS